MSNRFDIDKIEQFKTIPIKKTSLILISLVLSNLPKFPTLFLTLYNIHQNPPKFQQSTSSQSPISKKGGFFPEQVTWAVPKSESLANFEANSSRRPISHDAPYLGNLRGKMSTYVTRMKLMATVVENCAINSKQTTYIYHLFPKPLPVEM